MRRGGTYSATPRFLRALTPPRVELDIMNAGSSGVPKTCYLMLQGLTPLRSLRKMIWLPSNIPFHQCFSTGFTSVHGERPSAEFARLRKESLESKFGAILGTQRSKTLSTYYQLGPFLALYRAAIVSFHVVKLSVWHLLVKDIHKRALKFRETLIQLGPFYVKLGQALSTRPDILPNAYCQELSKLQDQIPPFSTRVALRSIESQLGAPINEIFADISSTPIAAASLGQVYKAHLKSGELVAVKVQRPGMSVSLTLDALLFNMIGGQLKRFAKARKDLLVAVNEMVRHMFEEIDYIHEAQNAERFASLYASTASSDNHKGNLGIKVPKIFWNYTRKEVLTMEWISGIKLTDSERINNANLNRKQLIDQGVYCSLRQLLEEGFFHADPHPGNLVATNDGSLAYFDFGMMGDIPRHYRVGLIQVLVHYVNRDSYGLANDFLSLGFIPDGANIGLIASALQLSFGNDGGYANDFQGIMDQFYSIMYKYDFSLPPDYALVIRALGSLEGTAKALDPTFKVVETAYPFVIGRLLSDPNPDMRKILRELLICNNGSIRWNRLERLVTAISKEASESVIGSTSGSGDPNIPGWKSFNMRAVVSATEDLLNFILSEKGRRVRIFIVHDIVEAFDAFLKGQTYPCFTNGSVHDSDDEGDAMFSRLMQGFQSLCHAVSLAPEVWIVMLIRMSFKPEVHKFLIDLISALVMYSSHKLSIDFWFCISHLLRKFQEQEIVQSSDSVDKQPRF